jgi:hypothetical protein
MTASRRFGGIPFSQAIDVMIPKWAARRSSTSGVSHQVGAYSVLTQGAVADLCELVDAKPQIGVAGEASVIELGSNVDAAMLSR